MNADDTFERATRAVHDCDVTELGHILRASPGIVESRDGDGHTLLGLACKAATGNVALPPVRGTPAQHAVVDVLLAAKADPSASASDGWAPLHVAAMTGHVDLARRLLAAGASREGCLLGARGGSPLSLALFYGQAEVAEVLADPPIPDSLRSAAALGRSLERFVDGSALTPEAAAGADFYRPFLAFPQWDRSCSRQELLDEALSWAARNDQCGSLEALVSLGANVNSNPYRGTPLLWATYGDCVAAATWLLDHGADPNLAHDFGGSEHGVGAVALHLAAQYGRLQCLRLLLARGADRNVRDRKYAATPLEWAKHGEAEAAIQLLEG